MYIYMRVYMYIHTMNIVKANWCVSRTISIESLKRKTGTKMLIANDSVKAGKFVIVPLRSYHKHICIDTTALIDKLIDAMGDRFFATNAAGTIRNSDAYQKLLDQLCVLVASES